MTNNAQTNFFYKHCYSNTSIVTLCVTMTINKWSPNVAEMRIGIKGSAKNRFVRQRKKKKKSVRMRVRYFFIEALVHFDTKIAEMDI